MAKNKHNLKEDMLPLWINFPPFFPLPDLLCSDYIVLIKVKHISSSGPLYLLFFYLEEYSSRYLHNLLLNILHFSAQMSLYWKVLSGSSCIFKYRYDFSLSAYLALFFSLVHVPLYTYLFIFLLYSFSN